jgi:hypothetical protein
MQSLGWRNPVRATGRSGSRQKFLYCPLPVKSMKGPHLVSVAAVESDLRRTMDSRAGVCYMNFGLCNWIQAGFFLPEEQPFAF